MTETETTARGDVGPPSLNTDEKTTLIAFLDYLREALIVKTYGLPDGKARTPGVPSGTSLLWLIKHMIAVELNWFEWAYLGADVPLLDDEARADPAETASDLVAQYRDAVVRVNAIIADCDDLDRPGKRSLRPDTAPSMRWLLVHVIEETARHAGHADILREQIDGATGR